MRRFFVPAVLSASLVLTPVLMQTAHATTGITATFQVHFNKGHPQSNAPCPADVFCGVGKVSGFGPATITVVDDSFEPIEGSSCFAATRLQVIHLLDGSGDLVIDSTGTFCPPGGSADSSAGPSSYGHPGQFDMTFTVVGSESTGVFAGATGSGIDDMVVAGGIGVWHLSGQVSLA